MTQTRRQAVRRLMTWLLFGPLAAACGAGGGQTKEVPNGPAQLKAGSTLVWMNGQTGNYPALMQRWADAFEQRTGVKVQVNAGIQDYDTNIQAAFAAGSPPDIFRYSPDSPSLITAVERNMLLKLDPFVKRDKYDLSDFRKEAIELYRWKGALYALPRDYGLQLIFYNTDLFAKEGLPPIPGDWNDKTWTFAKFLDACQRLTRTGERYALFLPRGGRLRYSWIYSNGGVVVKANKDGMATELGLAEKPATEALQFMQDLIYKHKVAPAPQEEATLGTNQLQLMQQGKLAMQIANPGQNNQYRPSGMPYDVGVFPLGPSGTRRGVGGGGTGWAITGPTKLPEEAWALISMISSRDGELDEVKIGQTTPSRTSVATSKEYLDPTQPPKNAKAFADGQEFVVRDPLHPKWADVERDVVDKTLNDQLWTNQRPAAQVVAEIKEKGDPQLKS